MIIQLWQIWQTVLCIPFTSAGLGSSLTAPTFLGSILSHRAVSRCQIRGASCWQNVHSFSSQPQRSPPARAPDAFLIAVWLLQCSAVAWNQRVTCNYIQVCHASPPAPQSTASDESQVQSWFPEGTVKHNNQTVWWRWLDLDFSANLTCQKQYLSSQSVSTWLLTDQRGCHQQLSGRWEASDTDPHIRSLGCSLVSMKKVSPEKWRSLKSPRCLKRCMYFYLVQSFTWIFQDFGKRCR